MVHVLGQVAANLKLEASAGDVWKYVCVTAIPSLVAALVFVAKKWVDEKVARLEEKNAIIAKLERAQDDRARRETERRGA